ncbi:hypothetical protein [Burkholderia cepacia]|uniref:hypothetical protein n=1 Tax=Burkholderia cepacia TaxID=292 RepID=UPI000B0F0561|nr:hypothetical protein [Burkholderia cepacia]
MKPLQTKRLARAVHRWLSFQRMCGRSMVFSESYLCQPIAEFISFHHPGKIRPELNHPQFATLTSGRPKQVDFALLTPNTSDVECVIESKWISDSAYSKQAILDDLLRLECFRDTNRHVSRYFLVGGLLDHFDTNFLGLRFRDAGTNNPFTPMLLDSTYGSGAKTVDVYGATGNVRTFYRKFHSGYGVDLPKKFKTTLVSRSRIDRIAVYMWKVESVQNRQTFSAILPAW